MTKNNQGALIRAYAMLLSLRKNIEQMKGNPTEVFVLEFHTVLDRLQNISIDIAEFRIPASEVKPKVTGVPAVNNATGRSVGHVSYSEEKYVDKSFILTKLDAILRYFEIITSEKPKRIGFRTSQE